MRVALDPQGNVVTSGVGYGPTDFADACEGGPGWFDLTSYPYGGFVAKFTSNGAPIWSRALTSQESFVDDMAMDPTGSTYLSGWFIGTLGFEGAGVDGGAEAGVAGSCDARVPLSKLPADRLRGEGPRGPHEVT
jgi:hypothetical protein